MLTKLVSYEYYTKTYGGSSIPESSFESIIIEASSKVNHYTFNRINNDNLSEQIKNTTCEIAELLFNQKQLIANINDNTLVANETVGPHSITYVNNSSLQSKQILSKKDLEKECYKICYVNLVQTGLMYRGVNNVSA